MKDRTIRVGITHGDINGIGYEVILKMLEDNRLLELCTPVVYGSAKIASFYRKALEIPDIEWRQVENGAEIIDGVINIVNVVGEDTKVDPGVATPEAGEAALAALECAVADLKDGNIDVLVTAPINKHSMLSDHFNFPGHTEYLQDRIGDGNEALMVLCNDSVRVALVTTHVPIRSLPDAITKEEILNKLHIFNQSLKFDFGIDSPKIAVLSLNPHAGENGMLGSEENEVIIPAIEEAKAERILAFGPYAADGFFGSGSFKKFDGILAMYHDQGLAPFKTLAMDNGVNFTAGLPYVRTSPDHGTGYDIAGRGLAAEDSMRSAVYAALDIYRCRNKEYEARRRPLRRQYYDKGPDNVVLNLE